MEKYRLQTIQLNQIKTDFPYQTHEDLAPEGLVNSIRIRGVMMPIMLHGSNPYTVIAGHRRFIIAQKLKFSEIPALIYSQENQQRDLFLTSIASNFSQVWSDFDRMQILDKAKDIYRFSDREIFEHLMPVLDLPPNVNLLKQYLEIAKLDTLILTQIQEQVLPFRGAHFLSRLSDLDQKVFARDISREIHLSSSELGILAESIYDLLRARKTDLEAFLSSENFYSILRKSEADRRTKAELFLSAVRTLRYPSLTDYEKRFYELASQIVRDSQTIKVEPMPSFEDEGYWIKAKLKNKNALEHFSKLIMDKKSALNSLFDIML